MVISYMCGRSKTLLFAHEYQCTDGYDTSGVLDTKVLKSKNLKVRLTASKGSKQYVDELKLSNKAKEADWVDAKVDRNGNTAEITVRPSFSDGGVKKPWFNKSSPAITPKSYTDLLVLAKQGIEQYWSRDGSRPNGIGQNINTMQGAYSVKVTADLTGSPKARSFKLIENLKTEYERSTSIPLISCIVHNAGFHSPNAVDQMFEVTAAHEFGHLILNAYGGGGFWKGYSSTHKGTTTWADQKAIPGNYIPLAGEIDLMHYQEKRPLNSTPQDPSLQNQRNRAVAAEQDVNSLLWLCRVRFND